MDKSDPAYAGQADYTPFLLKLYDPIVLGVVAGLVWRVPPEPLLDNYRRSATVTAAEDTKCLVIPRADFLAEIHGNPDLCFQLLVQMSRRVRELEQALSNE